jgi:hypothetical protein
VSRIQNTIKNAQHEIINVTHDRDRAMARHNCLYVHVCTVKKEARQENSEERLINHSNSKMRRDDRKNKANGTPTYLPRGGTEQ